MLKPKIKPQPYFRDNQIQLLRLEWRNIELQIRDGLRKEGNLVESYREEPKRNDFALPKANFKGTSTQETVDRLHGNEAETAQIYSSTSRLEDSDVVGRTSHMSKHAEVIKLVNNLLKESGIASTVDNSSTKNRHAKLYSSHAAAYNKRMTAFSRDGKVDEVLRLFDRMKGGHCDPNVLCFNTVLNCLVTAKRFEEALGVFQEMLNLGLEPNVSTYNILVKLYCCYSNQFEEAYRILGFMSGNGHKPDVTTYSTLITGLCRFGTVGEAKSLLDKMKDDNCYPKPNVYTYTPILQSFCVQGRLREAKELIESMWKNGCSPNSVAYNILINALCRVGNFDEVETLLKESESKGWQLNAINRFIYVNGLCKARKLQKAYIQLNSKNLDWNVSSISYNTVMNSFCKFSEWWIVLKLLGDMLKKGIVPETRTYNIVVYSLIKAGKLEEANLVVHNRVFTIDVVTYNTLINAYVKIREEAKYLYDKMTIVEKIQPDKFTYTIMIVMLCKQGEVSEAKHYFEDILRKGLIPDLVMYSAMINGFFKNEKLDDGLKLLDRMLDQGLVPNLVVYDSVLRAYCRQGFCRSGYISHVCSTIEKMLTKR